MKDRFIDIVEKARTFPDTMLTDVELAARYRKWTGKAIRPATVKRHREAWLSAQPDTVDDRVRTITIRLPL